LPPRGDLLLSRGRSGKREKEESQLSSYRERKRSKFDYGERVACRPESWRGEKEKKKANNDWFKFEIDEGSKQTEKKKQESMNEGLLSVLTEAPDGKDVNWGGPLSCIIEGVHSLVLKKTP